MNPSDTLEDMLAAFTRRDYAQASEHAENLREWLSNGGFMPTIGQAAITMMIGLLRDYANSTGIQKRKD